MKYLEALRTLRDGKKKQTPQAELTAAIKVVNERRNRGRVRRLKQVGYSDTEIRGLLYTAPDPPAA